MIKKVIIALFCCFTCPLMAQNAYEQTAIALTAMLDGQTPLSFKKAVFSVENAYFDNQLSEQAFEKNINFLLKLVKAKQKSLNYSDKDGDVVAQHAAIFKIMMDTTLILDKQDTLRFLPFRYDFDDVFGQKDWSTMFVTKLIATHKGNCHSMPYLYKILCEALHIPCYLSLAPNHIYIKNYAEKTGWYNTELTSASFPIDGWLMASGFIGLEAIQNGIYMDTLSDKQAVALCMLDLGKSYDRKHPDNDGVFVIKCCDLTLAHFPKCINALILKAETRKRQVDKRLKELGTSTPSVLRQQKAEKYLVDDMDTLYATIHQLGYRTMPPQMYQNWMQSLHIEREKYTNKAVIQWGKN